MKKHPRKIIPAGRNTFFVIVVLAAITLGLLFVPRPGNAAAERVLDSQLDAFSAEQCPGGSMLDWGNLPERFGVHRFPGD